MTRLLLTGARGFTGHHFAAAAETDYQIFPLQADLTDKAAVYKEITEIVPQVVVHLAAVSAVTHANEEELYKVNLFGSLNLLKALTELNITPRCVLLASSANVYGNTIDSPIKETVCPKPVNHYAMSKLAMEHIAFTYVDRLPLIIVRPFNYTGVGQDKRFIIPKLIAHFAQRAQSIELGNLEVAREFNDVRMICEIYLKLLSQGKAGEIYNVCSGKPVSLQFVIEELMRITDHRINITINLDLVRKNEVYRLCGSREKLEAVIGSVASIPLIETLQWMLNSAAEKR